MINLDGQLISWSPPSSHLHKSSSSSKSIACWSDASVWPYSPCILEASAGCCYSGLHIFHCSPPLPSSYFYFHVHIIIFQFTKHMYGEEKITPFGKTWNVLAENPNCCPLKDNRGWRWNYFPVRVTPRKIFIAQECPGTEEVTRLFSEDEMSWCWQAYCCR